ncbi:MAG: Hint domain-containing protein [Halocynthiibacter sp.]
MADYIIDANAFNAYYQYVGGGAVDDTVTINISAGFGGSITVDSLQLDGGIETVNVNVPAGWTLVLTSESALPGEDPPMTDYSYNVVDSGGATVGVMSIRTNILNVPCFCGGTTLVGAHDCQVAIEDLNVGDQVQTLGNGLCSVRWIGKKSISSKVMDAEERLRPIRLRKGSLGPNIPAKDLWVSRQHRILVMSKIAERMFGVPQVLLAAGMLLELDGVDVIHDVDEITYYHILFESHEVLNANGAAAESLYLGPQALKSLGPVPQPEIGRLFSQIPEGNLHASVQPAAQIIGGKRAKKLIARHIKNEVPVLERMPLSLHSDSADQKNTA